MSMRRPPKNFTVEVKRRNARTPSVFVEQAMPRSEQEGSRGAAVVAPIAADAYFRIPLEDDGKENAVNVSGRILPCLVTEAAISATTDAEIAEAMPVVRKRGRPRKERPIETENFVAPRKRGRPRKILGEPVKPHSLSAAKRHSAKLAKQEAGQVDHPALIAVPAITWNKTSRNIARALSAEGLPRGGRWRRRLPKILW